MRKTLASLVVTYLVLSFYLVLSLGALGQQADRPTAPPSEKGQESTDKAAGAVEKSVRAQDKAGPSGKKSKSGERAEGSPKLGASTEAEKLLDEAIAKIEALPQFQTDVRQVTEMLGYSIRADGRYVIGPDFRMLLELKVQLTNTTGSFKEVCDGRLHWRNTQVLDTGELIKIDLTKIRPIIEKPEFSKELRSELTRRLGFSGIVPLMTAVRDTQKLEEYEEGTCNDTQIPVYILRGHWREDAIGQANFRGQPLSLGHLPPYMPDQTTFWIGQKDGWPYRLRLESTKKFQGSNTAVTIEFLNPQIGVELPESLFEFEPPPSASPQDRTEVLVQQLTAVLRQSEQSSQKEKSPAGGLGTSSSESRPAPPAKPQAPPTGSPPSNQPKAKESP